MKWLIHTNHHKEGYQIDLPGRISNNKSFCLSADGVRYEATWNREDQTLYLSNVEDPSTEAVYRIRSSFIESFEDEPEVKIDMEYVSPGHLTKGYEAQAAIYIPGLKHKSSSSEKLGSMVRAPMAGKIISLNATEGQYVEKGQNICVIEAMKMENQITANASGVVKAVYIKEGDQLAVRSKILIIDNK